MKLDTKAVRVLMAQREINTQKELGAAIGISANAVSELFKGHTTPSLNTVGELCRVLGCTPNDILTTEELPQVESDAA